MGRDPREVAKELVRRHLDVSKAVRERGMGECVPEIEALVEEIEKAVLQANLTQEQGDVLSRLAFVWRVSVAAYRMPESRLSTGEISVSSIPFSMVLRSMTIPETAKVIVALFSILALAFVIGRYEKAWEVRDAVEKLRSERQQLQIKLEGQKGASQIVQSRLKLLEEQNKALQDRTKESDVQIGRLGRRNEFLKLIAQLDGSSVSQSRFDREKLLQRVNDLITEMERTGDVIVRGNEGMDHIQVRFISEEDTWVLPKLN